MPVTKVSCGNTSDLAPLHCEHKDIGAVRDTYLFFKLWSQRVLSKNVKRDLLEAEQEGRFDHGEGLIQAIPTGHHSQMHDLLHPGASCHRSGDMTPLYAEADTQKTGMNSALNCRTGEEKTYNVQYVIQTEHRNNGPVSFQYIDQTNQEHNEQFFFTRQCLQI